MEMKHISPADDCCRKWIFSAFNCICTAGVWRQRAAYIKLCEAAPKHTHSFPLLYLNTHTHTHTLSFSLSLTHKARAIIYICCSPESGTVRIGRGCETVYSTHQRPVTSAVLLAGLDLCPWIGRRVWWWWWLGGSEAFLPILADMHRVSADSGPALSCCSDSLRGKREQQWFIFSAKSSSEWWFPREVVANIVGGDIRDKQ